MEQEIKTEVKVFRIERVCKVCGTGTMIGIRQMLVDGKPRNKHQCLNDDCQAVEYIEDKFYPYTQYEANGKSVSVMEDPKDLPDGHPLKPKTNMQKAKTAIKKLFERTPIPEKRAIVKKKKL